MKKEFDNTNRGALFKNKDKKSDKSPEYTGSLNIDGKEFYLNGWVKEGQKGKYFSLSVKPKQVKEEAPKAIDEAYSKAASMFDSEIPF